MKIAVASDDNINLALHFGRTKGFILFDVADKKIKSRHYLENTFTGHAHGHHFEDKKHHHSHRGVLEALNDCQVIISHGMGRRMMDDLLDAGKEVFITSASSAQHAVDSYLKGKLENQPSQCCDHEKGQF